MAVAVQVAAEREDGIVVAVLPDGGDRYLSTNLFTTMLEPDFSFYDPIRRDKSPFKPVQEGKARIFVTGPPLDQPLTLQESRRFLLADLVTRFLKAQEFSVTQVVLIPDMDSRTIQGALNARLDLAAYTQRQLDSILGDLDRLGVQRADRYPKISDHLATIAEHVRALVDRGHAYEKLRSVYWNLSKSRDYGGLSRVDPRKVRIGTTVDLEAYEKLHPRDFALLKRATLAELKHGWCMKTDWGCVIPTWHIAAASVAISQLGSPIDIQVSGIDFVFPHLENVREIGEGLTGKPFANAWLLCERLWSGREEKNQGQPDENLSVADLEARGLSWKEIRYWLYSTHYRKPIHVTGENLGNAVQAFRRIREFVGRVQHVSSGETDSRALPELLYAFEQGFFDALKDDLNVPRGLAALFRLIRQVNPILDEGGFSEPQRLRMLEVLGRVDGILGILDLEAGALTPEETALMELRETARKAKRWDESDRIRDQLLARGIRVLDTSRGTRWERVGAGHRRPA